METIKKTSSTHTIKRLPLIVMLVMVVISFSNLFGLNISWVVMPLGIVSFFINKAIEKEPMNDSGLDIKAIGTNLRDSKIWIWFLMPIVMDAVCIITAKLFLPEYIEFETARASAFVSVELSVSSVLMFFVFALGEEIAWRAFFQRQLNKVLPIVPVLLLSSLLFTLGHLSEGKAVIVIYGLFFTFINSIFYGVVFHKTKNAWTSALCHFAANMFEVIVFVLMR